jgi:hypothetical protein
VVGLQELVKEVFVVSTIQDCKCRAQGAPHCNAQFRDAEMDPWSRAVYIWLMSPFSERVILPWGCVRFRDLVRCLLNFCKLGTRSCVFHRIVLVEAKQDTAREHML